MQLYSAHIYDANSSLLLNLEPRLILYFVLPSSGCVLASSLELSLPRYDDLLHFAWIVRRTNKSGDSNRNNPHCSNRTPASFSAMFLWSRNICKRLLDHSTSWEIVIFHFRIFTQSMQYTKDGHICNVNHRILSCQVPKLLHILFNDARMQRIAMIIV